MKLALNAVTVQTDTERIADVLRDPLRRLAEALEGDYGGPMDHLWVDITLVEGCSPHPFRFQKRVSGRNRLTGLTFPDRFNVGHLSLVPDLDVLRALPDHHVVPYVITDVLAALRTLRAKRSVRGFDADRLCSRLVSVAGQHGVLPTATGDA